MGWCFARKLLNAVNPKRAKNTSCNISADSARQNKVINKEQNEELPMFQYQLTTDTTFPTGEQRSRPPQLQHCHMPCPPTGQKFLCWALKILLQLVYQSAVTPTSDHEGYLSSG